MRTMLLVCPTSNFMLLVRMLAFVVVADDGNVFGVSYACNFMLLVRMLAQRRCPGLLLHGRAPPHTHTHPLSIYHD